MRRCWRIGGMWLLLVGISAIWFLPEGVPAADEPRAVAHRVEKGDSVWSLARYYHVTRESIIKANDLKPPNYMIRDGEVVIIPEDEPRAVAHRVEKGDSVWSLARYYHVTRESIIKANDLKRPDYIMRDGEVLVIPGAKPFVTSPAYKRMSKVCDLKGKVARTWRYIVVHHSATYVGNARSIDTYHRRRRHMKNGLAYHFVIGNGKGCKDGKIEVGRRWIRQLEGGHLSKRELNKVSIGICLIGNFQKKEPTQRQEDALVDLVTYLQTVYKIPRERVRVHREMPPPREYSLPGEEISLEEDQSQAHSLGIG